MKLEDMKWFRKYVISTAAFPYMMTLSMPVVMECSEKNADRGDPYPVIEKYGEMTESDENGYRITSTDAAMITRHVGGLTPLTMFHMTDMSACGESGISVYHFSGEKIIRRIDVFAETGLMEEQRFGLRVTENGSEVRNEYMNVVTEEGEGGVLRQYELGFRIGAGMGETEDAFFDLIAGYGTRRRVIGSFRVPELKENACFAKRHTFQTALYLKTLPEKRAAYLDRFPEITALPDAHAEGRISQISTYRPLGFADPRTVRYTDGSPVIMNGRIYFSVSARMAAGAYEMIVSWLPGTGELTQEGAVFFEYGDGRISADVASSILYDPEKKCFLIFNCSFSHGHVLAHGESTADLMHGIHIVRMERMKENASAGDTDFYAKAGDEDPDLYFDEERKYWILTICRLSQEDGKYHFYRFRSDDPFTGYVFEERTYGDHETGGSFVKTAEGRYFVCGADGGRRSVYYIYDAENFTKCSEAVFDRPDGGFRGWGTVVPVPCGSFTRYYWLTFDRIPGSSYNWSYGNLYIFEGGTEEGGMAFD